MSKILDDIKANMGLPSDDVSFDNELLMHINAVFADMAMLGIGPSLPIEVSATTEWTAIVASTYMNAAKSYLYLRVRLMFDPPDTGFVLASYERQIKELEWRLQVEGEN